MGNLNQDRTDFDQRWVDSIRRRIQPYGLTAVFHTETDMRGIPIKFEVSFYDGDITIAAFDVMHRGWITIDAFIDGIRIMHNRTQGYVFDIYSKTKHPYQNQSLGLMLEERVVRQAQEAKVVFID